MGRHSTPDQQPLYFMLTCASLTVIRMSLGTSATGFVIYAFATGVRIGLLPAATFVPAITQGWAGVTANVLPSGFVSKLSPGTVRVRCCWM